MISAVLQSPFKAAVSSNPDGRKSADLAAARRTGTWTTTRKAQSQAQSPAERVLHLKPEALVRHLQRMHS